MCIVAQQTHIQLQRSLRTQWHHVSPDQRCESVSGVSGISKAGKEGDARVNRGAM